MCAFLDQQRCGRSESFAQCWEADVHTRPQHQENAVQYVLLLVKIAKGALYGTTTCTSMVLFNSSPENKV